MLQWGRPHLQHLEVIIESDWGLVRPTVPVRKFSHWVRICHKDKADNTLTRYWYAHTHRCRLVSYGIQSWSLSNIQNVKTQSKNLEDIWKVRCTDNGVKKRHTFEGEREGTFVGLMGLVVGCIEGLVEGWLVVAGDFIVIVKGQLHISKTNVDTSHDTMCMPQWFTLVWVTSNVLGEPVSCNEIELDSTHAWAIKLYKKLSQNSNIVKRSLLTWFVGAEDGAFWCIKGKLAHTSCDE